MDPGVTEMDTRLAEVTVMVTELVKPLLALAEMVATPAEIPVATPEALTVITEVLEDDQVTESVKLLVVPSVKLALALN